MTTSWKIMSVELVDIRFSFWLYWITYNSMHISIMFTLHMLQITAVGYQYAKLKINQRYKRYVKLSVYIWVTVFQRSAAKFMTLIGSNMLYHLRKRQVTILMPKTNLMGVLCTNQYQNHVLGRVSINQIPFLVKTTYMTTHFSMKLYQQNWTWFVKMRVIEVFWVLYL